MRTFLSICFFIAVITSCSRPTNLDVMSLPFDNPSIQVQEIPKWDDGVFIPRPISQYYNVEAFSFGDFKPTNGGNVSDRTPYVNRIGFYFGKQKEKIIAVQIIVKKNDESSAFFEYLTNRYGKPVTLEEESTRMIDGIVVAAYLWKNVTENISIIASKTYSIEQAKMNYELQVFYVKTEDSEIFISDNMEVNTYEYLILQNSNRIEFNIDEIKARY